MDTSTIDTSIVVALISSSVALVTLVVTSIYHSYEIKKNKKDERRKEIYNHLNQFYGPLLSYLNVVKALYKLFKSNKPQNFRTLTYLLDPKQNYQTDKGMVKVTLSDVDKNLLEEIIETEKKIEDLILTKCGLVDNERLLFDYFPDQNITDIELKDISIFTLVLSHFRLLRMAYNNEISGDVERFKNFVYPRQFDLEIKQKIDLLRNELKQLNS